METKRNKSHMKATNVREFTPFPLLMSLPYKLSGLDSLYYWIEKFGCRTPSSLKTPLNFVSFSFWRYSCREYVENLLPIVHVLQFARETTTTRVVQQCLWWWNKKVMLVWYYPFDVIPLVSRLDSFILILSFFLMANCSRLRLFNVHNIE